VIGNHHLNLNENRNIPNGASGYYLLGFVLEKQFKRKPAIECYERALSLQPTLWCAFERLTKMLGGPSSSDGKVDAFKIFTENNSDIIQMNTLIREHMKNIYQVASAYNNQGVLGPSNIGVVVNNFDSSPIPTDINNDGMGTDKEKKPMMTPHHAIFGTN